MPLLINQISWKSKLNHMGVDITSFFQDAKQDVIIANVLWNQWNI